eukprot:7584770-Pyramimonas_sp.AAC.1
MEWITDYYGSKITNAHDSTTDDSKASPTQPSSLPTLPTQSQIRSILRPVQSPQQPPNDTDPNGASPMRPLATTPVSYTHLRAHETGAYL